MAAGGRRRSGLIFILLAFVLIILLAAVAFMLRGQLLGQPQQQQAEAVATQAPAVDVADIVVLSQPVSRGSVITEDVVTLVSYPRSSLVEGLFFTDVAQVVNKQARYDLQQGVPLTSSLVMDVTNGSYASTRIPRGMVAISIPITRLTSNGYSMLPGDHVNIIAAMQLVDIDSQFQTRLPNLTASIISPGTGGETGQTTSTITVNPTSGGLQGRAELDTTLNQAVYVIPAEDQRPRLVSQTLIQDATVLWVGDFPENGVISDGSPAPTPTPAAANGEAAQAAPTERAKPDLISLVVSPQDAVTLNYLMLSGAKLNLVLRSNGDDQRISTEAVTLQFILDQYNFPNPAKLPYGIEPAVRDLQYPSLGNDTP